MGNQGERKQRTRRSILEGAHPLFAVAGYEATSIEQVMRECDLTHGGFYAHFRSKLELYREAMEHAYETGWPEEARTLPGALGSPALAFLAADLAHEDAEVRAVAGLALRRLTGAMLGEGATESTRLSMAAMIVGALSVARASDDRSFRATLAASCEAAAGLLLGSAREAPAYFWEPAA